MKKLLYIMVNSKKEEQSTCKIVRRMLVNAILKSSSEIQLDTFEELLVDGTGTTEEERQQAMQTATERISDLVANCESNPHSSGM